MDKDYQFSFNVTDYNRTVGYLLHQPFLSCVIFAGVSAGGRDVGL